MTSTVRRPAGLSYVTSHLHLNLAESLYRRQRQVRRRPTIEQIAISISYYFVLSGIVEALLLSHLLQSCVERWRKRLQTRARGCFSAAVVKEWTARFGP